MSRLDTRTGAHYAPPPQKQGSAFSDAMRSLVDHQGVSSLHYVKLLRWDTAGSCDEIVAFGDAICRDASRRGIPLIVVEGWRSGQRQDELFAAGRTRARAGQSAHNYGMAVDVSHLLRGWQLSRDEWLIIGQIGKEVARKLHLRITWGGWQHLSEACGVDPAHFEVTDWRARLDPRGPL